MWCESGKEKESCRGRAAVFKARFREARLGGGRRMALLEVMLRCDEKKEKVGEPKARWDLLRCRTKFWSL